MKKGKIVSLFICLLILIVSAAEIAYAFPNRPTVSYNGREKSFVFVNTEETDLFPDFKEVVPGDVIAQEIEVRGDHITAATDFYLRAEVEEGAAIPESVLLHVYLGEKLISSSFLSDEKALAQEVHLCRMEKDGTAKLTAVLEVPTSVGNEISDMQQKVKWIFTVQEQDSDVSRPIQTGDSNNWNFAIAVNAASLLTIFFILFYRKKEEKEQNKRS